MKKYLLLACLATVALSSCCTNETCDKSDGFYVWLYGFNHEDVGTIHVTGYKKGSGFSQVALEQKTYHALFTFTPDSCFVLTDENTNPGGSQQILNKSLTDDYEWKVYIPATNKTMLIDNYGYDAYDCNHCRYGKARKGYTLTACSVNGARTKIDSVKIFK